MNSIEIQEFKNLIIKFIPVIVNIPDYNEFEQAKDFSDIQKVMVKHFPLTSDEYRQYFDLVRKYISEPKYPLEFILCSLKENAYFSTGEKHGENFSNNAPYLEFVWAKRSEVEWNPKCVQHIAACTLTVIAKDKEPVYIFLKRKYGEFKDMITYIEGHMAFDGVIDVHYDNKDFKDRFTFYDIDVFNKLAYRNMIREINEELDFGTNKGILKPLGMAYSTDPNKDAPQSLSFYHAGHIMDIAYEVTDGYDLSKIISKEPDKNEVYIIKNAEALKDLTASQLDSWVYANKYRILKK
jgi:hypothetical protein